MGKRRPLRRQPDDHNFGSLIMLAVTTGVFLLVAWVATKGLFFFLQDMIHYFNALVDVPNRGPFEARIAEQAIKLALLYHVFSRIEIEQRSAGTYGVKELDDELPPLGRLAMEAGLGISEWFAKCQDEYLAKKREEDKENVYYRFYQRFSKFPHFTTRELYSSSLGVQTAAAAQKYFSDWEDRGLLEQIKSEQSGSAGRRKLPRYRFTSIVRGRFA